MLYSVATVEWRTMEMCGQPIVPISASKCPCDAADSHRISSLEVTQQQFRDQTYVNLPVPRALCEMEDLRELWLRQGVERDFFARRHEPRAWCKYVFSGKAGLQGPNCLSG